MRTVLLTSEKKAFAKMLASKIEYAFDQEDKKVRVLTATAQEAVFKALEEEQISLFILCIHIPDAFNSVGLAEKIKEKNLHTPIIFISEPCSDSFELAVRKKIRGVAFLVDPTDPELVGEIKYALDSVSQSHIRYLPLIKQKGTQYRFNIDKTAVIRKVKDEKWVEVIQIGENLFKPDVKKVAIVSFSDFLKRIKMSEQKEFVQCERSTFINKNLIEEIKISEDYVIMVGSPERIQVGKSYQTKIYSLLEQEVSE